MQFFCLDVMATRFRQTSDSDLPTVFNIAARFVLKKISMIESK